MATDHVMGVATCFPDLPVAHVATERIDDGWDSEVVVLGGDVVVRLPRRRLDTTFDRFRREVLPLVGDPRARTLLDTAEATLVDPPRLAIVHADLGPAHLLCDDRGLAGVIDWSDACLGDPAVDLAWLLNGLGGRLREPLVHQLSLDPSDVARADLLHRLGPWWEVLHGLDEGRPPFVASGLDGVRSRLP